MDNCWLYAGSISDSGYGVLYTQGHTSLMHRVMYENFVGKIPQGLHIDHLCRVRRCINPKHLEPVTRRENILRGQGIAAQCARRTQCVNGHKYTQENTQRTTRGRECKECKKLWNKRQYQKRKYGVVL